jgi:ABC-2 type transport system ATP-binding protein
VAARLSLRRGRRRLGGVQALEDLTFTLQPGEWVGVVGPNGAGKTTLLRVLCGLERLDEGEVALGDGPGRRRLGARDRRRIGVVPQDVALYPLLTARENLRLFGRLNGLRGRPLDERVDWALAWTGLEDRRDARVRTLSGGMKRCLNIACSVLHRPDVLLLDEPTVGVDLQGLERITAMLRSLRDAGTSLLQSSHQLRQVQSTCDRTVVMYRGRLLASLRANGADVVGGGRTVRVTLDRDANGLALGAGFTVRGRRIEGSLGDVARQLPALLRSIEGQGHAVDTIRVEPPQLEDLLHRLTGHRSAS